MIIREGDWTEDDKGRLTMSINLEKIKHTAIMEALDKEISERLVQIGHIGYNKAMTISDCIEYITKLLNEIKVLHKESTRLVKGD